MTDLFSIPIEARKCASTHGFIESLSQYSKDKIDPLVRELLNEIEINVDCRQCGRCCKEAYPVVEESDKNALCKAMSISKKKLDEDYLEIDEDGNQIFRTQPCPLLQGSLCSAYEYRMEGCKGYPHLRKSNFTKRSKLHQYNYSRCPQVYHLIEALKVHFLIES